MFKRLRERIAEEATKFPVGQLANNSVRPGSESESKATETNSTEDLITLSDSSSVVVPHTSPQQFSIGEDEDGSLSEQSTPQKKQNVSSGDANSHPGPMSSGLIDLSFGQEYRPSKRKSYVPQSDIESEREDPPTLNLDGISKDQLMAIIQQLKARSYKYKNKYSEVVKNYRELQEEKTKIENTLIENQDKGLRRIAELREQCQLEQKAKAHLEENLRLLLEEKDSRICVLETQINLLKEGGKSSSTKTLPEDCDNQLSDGGGDTRSEDSATSMCSDVSGLQEKVERLHHQCSQDRKTITAQTEQITLLRKQNENLSEELEEKVKRLNEIEDEQSKLKSEHEAVLKSMQDRLNELEKQQEENVMSMAETKKNMHEELELKEKQLIKAEEESKQFQAIAEREKELVSELKKQQEEKIKELQHQLEITEKTLEDEKQNLLHELAQGKTAAIHLMQQECAKKISAVEEEWQAKYEALQSSVGKASHIQVEELTKSLKIAEEKLKKSEQQIKELDSLVSELEKENATLKNSVEKLESENLEAHHEESLKCMKDKLQKAEKNYKTQIEEMKLRINQLEKENSILLSEKENLLIIQNQFKELKNGEEKIQAELRSKEEEVKVLKEKLDTSNKEQVEKIHTFQENMKDKENMVLKLKTNIESISKEHKESVEELQKKIKRLEVEREQLMLQAQERVSATEAKCREAIKSLEEKYDKCHEDLKTLQEKCEKLQLENSEIDKLRSQLDESLLVAESNQAAANIKLSLLKDQLANSEKKLADVEKLKLISESEFTNKLEKLQQENKLLSHNSDHVERLKAEKEELNEQLKTAVQQVNKIDALQTERDIFKKENEELSKEIDHLRTVLSDNSSISEKLKLLESTESSLKQKIEKLNSENEQLKSEIESLKNSFCNERDLLVREKEKLLKHVEQLENCVSDPQNSSVQDYIETLKKEYEMAIKAKDDDMLSKLKQLVKDFSIQMDVKDKDSEQMIAELIEKNQYIEENLQKEYSIQMKALREDLLVKECALEEMRDSYEEAIQVKDAKIKEQELFIKSLSQKENTIDSVHNTAEPSDWDDTWVVPDEVAEVSSPSDNTKTCDEHMKQIETLQEELSKCNSEIKELKVLLRLSPPDTMVNNNNRRDSLQSIPEPTEFEYLKNIIYEYMMGKEPVTLAKVIAAVLRFNDVQTQQVIRREEARHNTR